MATTITSPGRLGFFLQVCDSAFPTGGYAHSFGLEQMTACGAVRDEASLLRMLNRQILPAIAHIDLPLLREAHASAASENFSDLRDIDHMTAALKLPRELRDASRKMGQRRLQILSRLRPTPALVFLGEALERGELDAHNVTVFASACSHDSLVDTLAAYFYQTIAGYCFASLKLLRIGQEGAQRILTTCLADLDHIISRSLEIPRDDIGWFDPAIDLASMHHEIANERLFIS